MTTNLSRRDFLKISAAASAAALTPFSMRKLTAQTAVAGKKRWFKGNLHQHNQWSDGEPLPEWAIDWYKSHGYHFVSPSDHNIFQNDELRFSSFGHSMPKIEDKAGFEKAFQGENSFWKMMSEDNGWAKLTQRVVDEAKERFGADSIRTKTFEGMTFVRLKPFDELAAQFEEPERFLMIPGYEQTGGCPDGDQVHMNFINVRETFPYIQKETPLETLRETFRKGAELYAGQDYVFTANHPLWRYYDFQPSDLIALPEIRLYELNNNGLDSGKREFVPDGWLPEKFWDIVNAYRASHDQALLFGMGSDDRHGYGGSPQGWSVVRASRLTIPDILAGIRSGDFYASNGLDFADIQFDGRTLAVKIDVKEEGDYRIVFMGTKKGYDPDFKIVETTAGEKAEARKVECYSDSIGIPLETVEGTEGSYTLAPDDLYVRAKIFKVTDNVEEDWKTRPAAWSQPYRG